MDLDGNPVQNRIVSPYGQDVIAAATRKPSAVRCGSGVFRPVELDRAVGMHLVFAQSDVTGSVQTGCEQLSVWGPVPTAPRRIGGPPPLCGAHATNGAGGTISYPMTALKWIVKDEHAPTRWQ
jgi:hypothetical protein